DLRSRWSTEKTAAARGDDDVLAAVFAHERHRHAVGARLQLGFPQLLAGLRFERAEAAIDGRTDEDQAAGGGNRAADVRGAGVAEAMLFQRVDDAKRHFPGDVTAIDVHRYQLAERRRRTRNAVFRIPESSDCSAPRRTAHPGGRSAAACLPLHHLRDL